MVNALFHLEFVPHSTAHEEPLLNTSCPRSQSLCAQRLFDQLMLTDNSPTLQQECLDELRSPATHRNATFDAHTPVVPSSGFYLKANVNDSPRRVCFSSEGVAEFTIYTHRVISALCYI